ncbi:linear amide C-N hydrolase [Aquiflexum sp. LQ15W]|uniref:linear amide C-N hydrolase n=1 Tax=Cognataquiflexum nitidum TaxID=2922272 RepID=UPI001F12CE4F|nr:linear amide C-N hydrolase [Cognataquiflexum nitidum]MCH6199963.1 linear amide C-N hydrolase [Cognataquiflexum nitidum]
MTTTQLLRSCLILMTLFIVGQYQQGHACTRVVYKGPNKTVITARSMDWKSEIPANLWVLPRATKRSGLAGENSVEWTSKYGSVVSTAWDIASADGMNEKGLVANLLWLVESEYPKYDPKAGKKGLAISLWAQYALDNFATVQEAVDHFSTGNVVLVSDYIPGTKMFTTVHLSISDANGDNAIFEYVAGKLVIHHDPSYTVMTNSPIFEEQLGLNKYWKNIPGTIMLPGTNRAADRFVRASYYIDAIPKTDKMEIAIPSVFSVIRNCSVPFGISTPDEPNISSTRWRSVSDQKNLVYYFETALTPNTFWVDLKKLDFSPGAKTKKLSVEKNETYAGESSAQFKTSMPFSFQGIG